MKRVAIALSLTLLSICSCTKKEDVSNVINIPRNDTVDSKALGFDIIPSKNVVWKIHFQGVDNMSGFDTNGHFYNVIKSTGLDTIINNYKYNVYDFENTFINTPKNQNFTTRGRAYTRYDSTTKKLICSTWVGNTFRGDRLNMHNDLDSVVGTITDCGTKFFQSKVVYGDSIKVSGVNLPCLYMLYNGQKYFYQAKGVGAFWSLMSGVGCPSQSISGNAGVIRSFSFMYGSDSLYFEYPSL